ncbi:LapA family protein [Amycolatopsis sp. FDAARGOS 1241]|uniref:channel accessory protein ArfB n=1 Tax=Amycolatopsis sp. FDAARGOS 1241 TaxID=2778070 RepID=UPI0019511CCE|nr:LapA family protein [Amycolatopsis sp. FDAARGOS 1241]QRP46700.1 hypothetical protein I6J71_01085 [Amycolatopsis sp. FDAARGOS 1241]
MLWLFGQIWLWLLVAFLLGALVMWLITRAARPKPRREAEAAVPERVEVPEPVEAERTQYIPVTHYDEPPERVYNDYPDVDPDEPYAADNESGHRTGELPDAEPRLSGDLNWPAADGPAGDWPREDEAHESAPRRPGRGG